MTTILVVDDMAVFREPIAASLRSKGFETICAADGREALRTVRTSKPDLVLLDVAMPNMDGLEFLQAIKADPALSLPPVILLTAVAEQGYVVKAAQLGVRDYLLKSQFSLDELMTRVKRCLEAAQSSPPQKEEPETEPVQPPPPSAAVIAPDDPEAALKSLKPILRRSEVVKRLEQSGELKALSPSVAEVLKMTRNARCSVEHVAKPVKRDPAIAIKILKLANSSVYTRGEPVETIERAITRIGLQKVRQVMLNISVIDHFSSSAIGEHVTAGQFWEHAISCGVIAAEIAHARKADDPDSAFTEGLVHDVGRVICAQQLGEEYQTVLQAARDHRLPLEQVESRMLLLNHADGMDRLLHRWHFRKEFIDPVVFHHLSVAGIRKVAPRRVAEVATLALANRLSHAMLLGSSGNETIYPTEEFFEVLELDEALVQRVEDTARDQTDSLKLVMLASSNETAWVDRRERYRAELAAPFRPQFVSARPQFDAYRILCEQLAEASEAAPNVGVIHVSDPRARKQVFQQYEADEAKAGVERLPVVILCPRKDVNVNGDAMANRHRQVLLTPVHLARFTEAINHALECAHSQAAAA